MDEKSYQQAITAFKLDQKGQDGEESAGLLVQEDQDDMFGELQLPTESMHEVATIKSKFGSEVPTEAMMIEALLIRNEASAKPGEDGEASPETFSEVRHVVKGLKNNSLDKHTPVRVPRVKSSFVRPLSRGHKVVAQPKSRGPVVATAHTSHFAEDASSEGLTEIPSKFDLEKELDAMVGSSVSNSNAELLAELPLEGLQLQPFEELPSTPPTNANTGSFPPLHGTWQPYQAAPIIVMPHYQTRAPARARKPSSVWWILPFTFASVLALGMLGFWVGSLL